MSLAAEPIQVTVARPPISARIERDLIVALAFVLPLFEAPKNILWAALLAVWLINRCRARDFGGRWDKWDTLIATWIGSGFVVAAFAGIRGDEWRAAADIARYASVLWVLKRSRYPDPTWFALIAAIILGTVAALAWGYYGVLVTGENQALGLHSVGHVNQSSNYLAMVCGIALALARAHWQDSTFARRAAVLALLALFVVSLFWMQSRASVGVAFIMAFSLLSVYAVRRRESVVPMVLAAFVATGAVLVFNPQVVQKNTEFARKSYWLNGRDQIWRVGLAAWREFPLFGVGMDNFGRIDVNRLEAWSARRGEALDREAILTAPHGHSLLLNTLAERGLFGLGTLLAVLTAWAAALIRRLPEANAPPLVWIYWGSAASAWIVTVLAGALNTTLHHEQALLSALVLGGWLSLAQRDRSRETTAHISGPSLSTRAPSKPSW